MAIEMEINLENNAEEIIMGKNMYIGVVWEQVLSEWQLQMKIIIYTG